MDLDSADIAETIRLKAVSLTHVRYARGDLLGHALSWFSLLPVFIGLGGFMSHFLFRRELQAMFFGLGLILNEVINQVLLSLDFFTFKNLGFRFCMMFSWFAVNLARKITIHLFEDDSCGNGYSFTPIASLGFTLKDSVDYFDFHKILQFK